MKFPLMQNNITRKDLNNIIQYLKKNDPILTSNKNVLKFEKLWSKWLGVKYSTFVNSGSSANLISISILKFKFPKGGEVIVPPLTWISDVSSVIQNGFKPVFADIDYDTLSMSSNEIISRISSKTVAVFLTHAQGFNGLSKKLLSELKKRKILLIEDVCESHGASFNNKKLGSFGWTSNFSFYYAHHMSTIEGGMISTNDYETYQISRMLRGHGMLRESNDIKFKKKIIKKFPKLNKDFIFMYPGYNMRNNEIGAILGINQLKRLNTNIKKRTSNFKFFLSKLDPKKFKTNFKLEGSSNYALNLILQKPDKKLMNKIKEKLKKHNVEYRVGSAGGGNQLRQPYLKNLYPNLNYRDFPKTEHIHFFGMYIGNYPELTKKDITYICNLINTA